ncbi:MAG: apolipoprotein N-acyltransferase, partial [Rickettsiales bacterium]
QIDGLLKLSPLICYESIFPSISVDRNNHPNWILNVTNDGWFGKSIGPYQHFMMSKTRAIEQGIPMVRVANTGISSVIDPYGRILSYISLGSEGVIESKLPKKLDKRTIYSQYGDLIIFIFVVISYIIFGLRYFRNKQFS